MDERSLKAVAKALAATIERLEKRVADYHTQTALAASTDYPAGE